MKEDVHFWLLTSTCLHIYEHVHTDTLHMNSHQLCTCKHTYTVYAHTPAHSILLHLLALISLWKEIKYASISELFVDPLTCLSSPP